MFLEKRHVPLTPPSLVKLYFRLCAFTIGSLASAPMIDHVPELIHAKCWFSAGTAATADPVSWQAGAITGTRPQPSFFCNFGQHSA